MRKSVFIVGATASGKSRFAIEAAQIFKAPIINCDSIQFYKDLIIGSAAPSSEEKLRCPHYLFQTMIYPQEMTAGEYTRQFQATLEHLNPEIYFVVGGTGFYFQAIEFGMYEVEAANESLREELENLVQSVEGHQLAYTEMITADPDLKDRIHFADKYRIVRALEILKTSNKKPSQMAQQKRPRTLNDQIVKIGFAWDINVLRRQIQRRTKMMLKNGLVEEVRALIAKGVSKNWLPLNSVGYKETMQYLDGQLSYKELESLINIRTGQLAKKQMTWFKRDSEIQWFKLPIEEKNANLKSDEEFEQDLSQGLQIVYQQAIDYLQIKFKD